jgi:hypothetical protein
MAAAIGIPEDMAAAMGVSVRRNRSTTRSRSSGSSISGASSSSNGDSSSSCSSCSCSSSSSGSSSVVSGPALPDLVVNASPNDAWLATPVHIPLSRAVPVAVGDPVASTSGVTSGPGNGAHVRPWRMDIRQRRLERTLLDARGQEVPRRSEYYLLWRVNKKID